MWEVQIGGIFLQKSGGRVRRSQDIVDTSVSKV